MTDALLTFSNNKVPEAHFLGVFLLNVIFELQVFKAITLPGTCPHITNDDVPFLHTRSVLFAQLGKS